MASLDSAKLIGREKEMPQVPVFPVLYYSLPDDYSYMMSVDPDELRIKRELFKGNVATESKVLSVLNGNKVDNMEDIGALTSFPLIQPGGSKVADCQGNRGIINVFDYLADTGFSLVGCGVETDMESSLERRDKNMSEYGGGNGYKDFFAVIANDYDNGQLTGQSLLFFDWEGNPLVKVILPMKDMGVYVQFYLTPSLEEYSNDIEKGMYSRRLCMKVFDDNFNKVGEWQLEENKFDPYMGWKVADNAIILFEDNILNDSDDNEDLLKITRLRLE